MRCMCLRGGSEDPPYVQIVKGEGDRGSLPPSQNGLVCLMFQQSIRWPLLMLCAAAAAAGGCRQSPNLADLARDVRARESAFAKTMADRDHAAFTSFVSDEAVFIGAHPLRGRQQVADAWKRFFEGAQAPFSWKPETVELLPSGKLAMTSGPVTGADGKPSGSFNSIWRLDDDGTWRIVFDKGCP